MNYRFRKLTPITRRLFAPLRFLLTTFFPITYVKTQYQYLTRHRLNLKNPLRYTEKLQFLRLFVYPKDPQVIQCAGRVGVRQYIKDLGLEKYLIPTLGIFNNFEEIDFSKMPKNFVLKCSHACSYNQIFLNQSEEQFQTNKDKFGKWLATDYGQKTIEKHYSPIKPQILAEKFIGKNQELPTEYKIHVFNGKAKNLYVVTGRGRDIRYTNYFIDWTPFDGSQFNGWKKADLPITKPENFDEMILLAEKLAAPFPFVRVDLYNIDGKIYFGEMTFTPAKGTLILDEDDTDFVMGKWLNISKYLEKNNESKK